MTPILSGHRLHCAESPRCNGRMMGIAESILSQIEGFHPILRFYVKKAVVSIAYPEQAEGSNHERVLHTRRPLGMTSNRFGIPHPSAQSPRVDSVKDRGAQSHYNCKTTKQLMNGTQLRVMMTL